MKKHLILTVVLFLCSTSIFAQFENYESLTTNKELIERLESDIEKFESMLNFLSLGNEFDTPREVKPKKFHFDQKAVERQVDQSSQVDLKLINLIRNGKIAFSLQKDPLIYNSLYDINAKIYLNKIYYYDGSTETPKEKQQVDTRFPNEFDLKKAVDKIDIELVFTATKQQDSIVIPAKKNEIIKRDGFVFEIFNEDKHSVTIKTNAKDLAFTDVHAITQNNKRIENTASSTLTSSPEAFEKNFSKLIKQMNKTLAMAKNDSLMTFDKFKVSFFSNLNSVKKEAENIFEKESNDDYITYVFNTAVKEIIMYYDAVSYERKVPLTIQSVKNKKELVEITDEGYSLYNLDGKLTNKITGDYFLINNRFYEDNNRYYHYDQSKKTMTPLLYYTVASLPNDFILAKDDDEADYILYDASNKKIRSVDSFTYVEDFDVALIKSNGTYYFINSNSKEPIEIKEADKVYYAEKGFFIVEKNNKFGFLDATGKMVVPCLYDQVIPFSDFVDMTRTDHLFGVMKNGKWGYVDAKNQVVIPLEYTELLGPFSYGIAPVYIEKNLGLINLKNEKISKFSSGGSYSSASNFGKRELNLSDGNYNYKGELEKK